MPDIVISEFVDQAAVDTASGNYELVYDTSLVDRPGEQARQNGISLTGQQYQQLTRLCAAQP